MLFVCYGKFTHAKNKNEGVFLDNVYYWGLTEDKKEADAMASECATLSKASIIVPKVFQFPGDLKTAMEEAMTWFIKLGDSMIQTQKIITKKHKKL